MPETDGRAPDPLQALSVALQGNVPAAAAAYADLMPEHRAAAAALALREGRPHLAASWATDDPLLRSAALLRLGQARAALDALQGAGTGARPAVLRARAHWQERSAAAPALATEAIQLARQARDGAALTAAVTLQGEQHLSDAYAALRTLAEGLRIAESQGQPADAHLLAVLAHVHLRLGGPKGARTAAKALARSDARSPARVLALLALHRDEDALAEAQAGHLHAIWWDDLRSGRPPIDAPPWQIHE